MISYQDRERMMTSKDERGVEVFGLRQALGKLVGQPKVSRERLARLLGVASPTIQKWENGGAPSAASERKLRELEKRLAEGRVTIPDAEEAISAPATPLFYSNDINVERGEHDARLRFSLVLGDGKRAMVDVVVPVAVLDALG